MPKVTQLVRDKPMAKAKFSVYVGEFQGLSMSYTEIT